MQQGCFHIIMMYFKDSFFLSFHAYVNSEEEYNLRGKFEFKVSKAFEAAVKNPEMWAIRSSKTWIQG